MGNCVVLGCAVLLAGSLVLGRQPQTTTPQQGATNPQTGQAAQPGQKQAPMSPELQELTNMFDAKIHGEWEAIKNKDQKALGEYLTDDFIGVENDREGERYKWKAQMELEYSAVTNYQLSFLKVTPLCQQAAFVRYEVFITFPPKSVVKYEKLLVGEVWVKRDGQWKLMHHQETNVK
jgi:hypothetical protein